ncbi:MAG: phosphonate ABC transporter, permease protein PhnE [Candidatus Synoicihabitans palmerolidicus]|nr:phosphonate ABC transporter, permease protein PhnE [Candidatus Synoicihabitans palmerolidicus]
MAHIRTNEQLDVAIDYDTLPKTITVQREETLVQPAGYLWFVLKKMAETFKLGCWGTLLAVVLSAPLALLCARNYAPHPIIYGLARAWVSFVRSIPELVSALIFVLAYGFGPIAGMLALGLHCTGFLAKFYAEDIENAERGPQDALFALDTDRLRVLRVAVLPQVLPQYVAYTLYILDRNLRMATVVGIVGAGGIGQELKGRWDLFHYSHVATILLVLFASVLLLDQLSARFRFRLIG